MLIATEEFAALASHERQGLGMSTLPIALIAHPLGDQPMEGVAARAKTVLADLVRALTTPADRLAAEERDREYPEPTSVFRAKPIFS